MAPPIDTTSRGLRSGNVRQSNLSAILRQLHVHGPASRSDLVAQTGLTRSAVGALVGELTDFGLVREERAAPDGTPGRPSPLVVPRAEDNVVLAMEVLVDSVAVAAVGLGGVRLSSVRRDRSRDRIPVEQTVQDLAELTEQVVATISPTASVFGIGVAVAGLIRSPQGRVMVGPNIGWNDVDIRELLSENLGRGLPVAVMNDADCGGLAEVTRGAAAGLDHVLYISFEVGVGGGVVSRGERLPGVAGFAGEVGHVLVNIDGEKCNCGARGCWETEVGEEALLRRAGWPIDGGRRALDEIIAAADAGDPIVVAALQEHGRWVGIGLASLVNVLNPEAVVLGGFLGAVLPFLSATLDRELQDRAMAPSVGCVRVVPAALGVDSALMGAAELAWRPVLADVAATSAGALALSSR